MSKTGKEKKDVLYYKVYQKGAIFKKEIKRKRERDKAKQRESQRPRDMLKVKDETAKERE